MEFLEISNDEQKQLYIDAYNEARKTVYKALNVHVQMLANENDIVVHPHRYPCMTISILLREFKKKYGIPYKPIPLENA